MAPRLIGVNSQWLLPGGHELGNNAASAWHSVWLKHLHCVSIQVS